jgi:hypothetical protein
MGERLAERWRAASKRVYEKALGTAWKKYVVGAGGGATAWKVIEKLIAIHFPSTEGKLVAWAVLLGVISAVSAVGYRGRQLVEDTVEEAADAVEDVTDD